MVNGKNSVSLHLRNILTEYTGTTNDNNFHQFEHQFDVDPDNVVLKLEFNANDMRNIEYWFE